MADIKGKSQEVSLDTAKTLESSKLDEAAKSNRTTGEIKQTESDESIKITSAYIDRIEELEDGESEAVLYIDDDESEESTKIVLPVSLLPNEIYEGDYVLIKVSYDKDKSN